MDPWSVSFTDRPGVKSMGLLVGCCKFLSRCHVKFLASLGSVARSFSLRVGSR